MLTPRDANLLALSLVGGFIILIIGVGIGLVAVSPPNDDCKEDVQQFARLAYERGAYDPAVDLAIQDVIDSCEIEVPE